MIVYVDNDPKNLPQKIPNLIEISEFISKVTGFNFNIKRNLLTVYILIMNNCKQFVQNYSNCSNLSSCSMFNLFN